MSHTTSVRMLVRALAVGVLVISCSSKDNSGVTDKAANDLRAAQSTVATRHDDVTTAGDDVERRKRDLGAQQQQLADKEKSLDDSRQQLGSAQATLADARKAYAAAVEERFAKLDADVATLATRTDARSIDARAGLTARRDALAAKLAVMPDGADATWTAYTKDVDTTFDAIERDLRSALH